MAIISMTSITKYYSTKLSQVLVFNGINLEVTAGEQLAIVGDSGSGKSTLLQLMGGLLHPSSGTIKWSEENIWELSQHKRTKRRNHHIGFVYQSHNLLDEFTALENVALPLMIRGEKISGAKEQAKLWLQKVGLEHRYHHTPQQLSGGERQRTGIARALCGLPNCILADEPTGNLDHKAALNIFTILQELSYKHNIALVLVTHNLELAKKMPTNYTLTQGYIERNA
ncbi:ABC transporter ATP-binding protein [Candidatus Ichthyocystis hellenicum]|uniref:ABC transporter ATP-binding protein n=1 Tax=Candidatus Ichthyocystis hellenicum TaxID=1561003 RepID=UPI000AC9D85A|nr:ABC transporter ATP-binding protein [Candidatus Ichthyocystis hellenicum]